MGADLWATGLGTWQAGAPAAPVTSVYFFQSFVFNHGKNPLEEMQRQALWFSTTRTAMGIRLKTYPNPPP
jgi:hypothetical protein